MIHPVAGDASTVAAALRVDASYTTARANKIYNCQLFMHTDKAFVEART
jgi:hypothetical protein